MSRPCQGWHRPRRTASWFGALGAAVLIALLAEPALTGAQRPEDWYQHLWYVWHQSESLRANHAPSLFTHNTPSLFDAHYAFYGGTLYALTGALALAVGSVEVAFAVSWLLALGSAYGGMYWLGRQARLDQWTAHAPAILLICSSYLLNIIYRTGAWAELVAVSAIPLLMASAISLMRANRLRLWPAVALATSTVLFTGSHNITLLWGTTMLVVVGGTLVACLPSVRRAITREGVLRLAAVLIPAVLVNAWFLLPNLAYQSITVMAGDDVGIGLKWSAPMTAAKYVFSLGRASSPERFYVLALPVVAVVWVVAGLFVTRSARKTPWFRAVLVLLGITAALTVLMTRTDLISSLPRPWPFIQFGFRLQIYILLCLCVATIGVLRLAGTIPPGRARTLWRWAAVPVLVLMVVQAADQTRASPPLSERTGDRREVRTYLTEMPHPSEAQYTSRRLPVIQQLNALANFPVEAEDGDRAVVVLNVAPGALLLSNFMLMPPLVAVTGAKIVGRHDTFRTVLQVPANAPPGPTTITIEAARPWPVVLGRVLSVVGLLGLLANGVWIALARRRRRIGVPT